MEERLENLQAQMAQMTERMAESRGDLNVALQRQADAIEALHEKADMLAEQMRSVSNRVSAIEKEPGERWKKIGFEIIKYIVLAAVGAAIGYFSK